MIFKVKNLGYIEEAEVDLSKDLIVFTGQNNTGKTYLAYAIYATLEPNTSGFEMYGANPNIKLNEEGNYSIDLIEAFKSKSYQDYLVNQYWLKRVIKNLSDDFAVSNDFFNETSLKLEFTKDDLDEKSIRNYELNEHIKINGYDLEYKKESNSNYLNFTLKKGSLEDVNKSMDTFLIRTLRQIALDILLSKIIFIPAERKGISLFQKELLLIKNRTINLLYKSLEKRYEDKELDDFLGFLNKRLLKYSKPVRAFLEKIQEQLDYKNKTTPFSFLADELEQCFFDGQISINTDGDFEFMHNSKQNIELHMTSSTIKSLSFLVLYLRHLAQKGDCIIIDEPELNLHPDNQRKIARFLGRLVNEGFQVIISTHSDYIIKELNSMIMLSKAKGTQDDLIQRLGFRGDELLKSEQVEAQLFTLKSRKPEKIEITEEGFSVSTIDEVMETQDNLIENIYYELFEKAQETVTP